MGVDGLKMVKKTPGKCPGVFKYPKFLILDDTLKPQKICSGYVQNSPQPYSNQKNVESMKEWYFNGKKQCCLI